MRGGVADVLLLLFFASSLLSRQAERYARDAVDYERHERLLLLMPRVIRVALQREDMLLL